MSALSEKLATTLNSLSFVQAVEHEQNGTAIQILCRVRPHFGVQWAALAELILRAAITRENTPVYWHTHIARVYMIRNGNLVYGWTFMIAATDLEKATTEVCQLVAKFTPVGRNTLQTPQTPQPTPQQSMPVTYSGEEEEIREDEDYTDPEGPLPKGAVPEADERGNPIVPRSHRVKKVVMAGYAPGADRNVPDPKKRKGAWSIESRKGKAFRPPVRS